MWGMVFVSGTSSVQGAHCHSNLVLCGQMLAYLELAPFCLMSAMAICEGCPLWETQSIDMG